MNYKLTIFPSGHHDTYIEFLFEKKDQVIAALNTSADLLIFMQDKAKIMDDYSNFFIAEVKIDGVWIELEDEIELYDDDLK
jgi:hypothetical protein